MYRDMAGRRIRNPQAYAAAVARNRFQSGFRRFASNARREFAPVAREFARGAGINRGVFRRQARRFGQNLLKVGRSALKKEISSRGLGDLLEGMGDYHVGRGFKSRKSRSDYGKMSDSSSRLHEKGEMTIEHSEYIGDFVMPGNSTSQTFSQQSFGLNPANPITFPWLSTTAVNFQDYRFEKLVFEYRPLASEAVSSSGGVVVGLGSVVMATQYDSNSCYSSTVAYPNKQTMQESDFSISVKPSEHALMAVECNPRFNPLGVLYTSPSTSLTSLSLANGDIRMQNLGAFQIAGCGVPTGTNGQSIGEIWVHYKVKLMKPQFNEDLSGILACHYKLTTSISNANPFGNSQVQQPGSTLNLTFASGAGSNTAFLFPQSLNTGSYLVVINWTSGTAWTGVDYTAVLTPTGAATFIGMWSYNAGVANTTLQVPTGGTANSANQCLVAVVQINQANSSQVTFTLSGGPTYAGTVIGDLTVSPFNYYIIT